MIKISLRHLIAVFFFLLICSESTYTSEEAPDSDMMPPIPLNERVLRIPGDPVRPVMLEMNSYSGEKVKTLRIKTDHPVMLEVTLYTPSGSGPFPLAIMNHGADGSKPPKLNPRYRITYSAFYFLSRGYAVALPMMRGFAGSDGNAEHHGCDVETVGINNAKDIACVIDYFTSQSYIDANRIVVAGQSFGGWNTLAFGTLHHPKVLGLVNFAGGMTPSDCSEPEKSLVAAAESFGAHTAIPSIWFYGDNDKVFSTNVWRSMFERYTAAGGKAELVAYGKFMEDSHNMLGFPEGLCIWLPKLDAFLNKVGLPSKLLYPEYLPAPFPPPSHYAAIDDLDSIPYLNEQGQKYYQKFLTKPMPRVFVIDPSGSASIHTGGFDPVISALKEGQKQFKNCQLYAVDDYVVWTHPTPVPPPTHFALLNDYAAVPYLNEAGHKGYQKFLTLRKPRAFVIAPDGAWSATSRGDDPLARAMHECSKGHQGCRCYALDDNIVWPEGEAKK